MIFDTIALQDGARAVIRRALPHDLIHVDAMHRRISANSLYFRYLRPYTPTLADAHRICQDEEDKGAGVVAVVQGSSQEPDTRVIGAAHYASETRGRQIARTAEPAVLVEDRYQGQGVGQLLFQALCQHAYVQGIYEFHAHVHPANERMMRTIHQSGYPFQVRSSYGVHEVRVLLLPRVTAEIARSTSYSNAFAHLSVAVG